MKKRKIKVQERWIDLQQAAAGQSQPQIIQTTDGQTLIYQPVQVENQGQPQQASHYWSIILKQLVSNCLGSITQLSVRVDQLILHYPLLSKKPDLMLLSRFTSSKPTRARATRWSSFQGGARMVRMSSWWSQTGDQQTHKLWFERQSIDWYNLVAQLLVLPPTFSSAFHFPDLKCLRRSLSMSMPSSITG